MTMVNHIDAICPYCKVHVNFSWTGATSGGGSLTNYLEAHFRNEKGVWVIGVCTSCKNCVLINGSQEDRHLISHKIYPYPLPSPVNEKIPSLIKKELEEAKLCFSVGAFNASAVMSRRSLQRACKEKGATKKELYDQIAELADKKTITEDMKDLAHTVRLVGNDGAHPNDIDVSDQEAKEILELAEQFMGVVFVAPARVREIQERRQKDGTK